MKQVISCVAVYFVVAAAAEDAVSFTAAGNRIRAQAAVNQVAA
jgi:hypothetical protein